MDHLGTHRSLDPPGALPQQALVLDPSAPLRPDEILIDVEYLNVDSASWHQIRAECSAEADRMRRYILELVERSGKMHNPVTGSGGMLVGTVSAVGAHRRDVRAGERIATLVSLTLTPLVLDEIRSLDPASEKVAVRGRAILFGSGRFARLPDDLDDHVALGVLDVCGAPAWMTRLVRPGMKVVVVGGGGRSGMLAAAQARRVTGDEGRVLALCWPAETVAAAEDAGAEAVAVDCTDALNVVDAVTNAFAGELADLVVVCPNVAGCEGGAILACDDDGRVLFFSMATSFTAAALLAEGLGRSCEMTIGSGYVPGHADLALELVRSEPALLKRFAR